MAHLLKADSCRCLFGPSNFQSNLQALSAYRLLDLDTLVQRRHGHASGYMWLLLGGAYTTVSSLHSNLQFEKRLATMWLLCSDGEYVISDGLPVWMVGKVRWIVDGLSVWMVAALIPRVY